MGKKKKKSQTVNKKEHFQSKKFNHQAQSSAGAPLTVS